ncbi:MAG: caspase family protein [Methanosarcina sp.]|uniref:caspase family protein n=1 Tax=Methanosarcina sp. TaxID=2213 RepID=UPI0026134968|nr:caspase family protein [Methanosarcina sp.]MDD3247910.1 caspase family protein [Methanosarcina sp.]MDD4248397.1 caspase family protein [Methanosarcina sp.]
MVNKALCVGINDYPYEGNDLNGCVNDAKAWADLLVDHYGFARDNVKLMLDAEATKANIMAYLESLVTGAKPGDMLVFTNSSHGTYVADTSGDEEKYDEAICPYDIPENLIIDDDLRELFAKLAEGVSLTVISDSCFSGTVTRAAVSEIIPGLKTPDDRRMRFLNPALMGRLVLQNPWKAKPKGKTKYPESKMKDVLLSGCTDKEYSYDALIGGTYHGAMTYFALQAIQEANYQITLQQLHKRLLFLLDNEGYNQHPELEGKTANKKKQIFA